LSPGRLDEVERLGEREAKSLHILEWYYAGIVSDLVRPISR
jgi:hypothetical protein